MIDRNPFVIINVSNATSHTDTLALCSSTRDLFPPKKIGILSSSISYDCHEKMKYPSVFTIVHTTATRIFLQNRVSVWDGHY